jgi:cyclopropane fatty-acyl-phospholipid synthase-like methyltransferase
MKKLKDMTPQEKMKYKREGKMYKFWVNRPEKYYRNGKVIFELLLKLGLKKHHSILDMGCGSLSVGQYLIPWLHKNRYHGLEPEKWLIDEALKKELPKDIMEKKNPQFNYNKDFNLKCFNKKFDFIIATHFFVHASKSEIQKCYSQLNDIKKENGLFLCNFFLDDKDNELKTWRWMHHVRYTKKYIDSIFQPYERVHCSMYYKQLWLVWRG